MCSVYSIIFIAQYILQLLSHIHLITCCFLDGVLHGQLNLTVYPFRNFLSR